MPLNIELSGQPDTGFGTQLASEKQAAWEAKLDACGAHPRREEVLLLLAECPDPSCPDYEALQKLALSLS